MLLRNPFVQVPPLEVSEIGRKQPAIAFNVSPMAPPFGRMKRPELVAEIRLNFSMAK